MPITVTMPRLSDTMEQGTVIKWHVAEGDTIEQGQLLADIETDKATMELESFDTGIVAKLTSAEGEKIAVGEAILIIAEEGESVADVAKAAPAAKKADGDDTQAPAASTATMTPPATPTSPTTPTAAPAQTPATPAPQSNGRVFASPLAKKIAAERGIDLGTINGSGPAGRIVRKDVESLTGQAGSTALAQPPAAASPTLAPVPAPSAALEDKTVPLNTMREIIAKRLIESKTTIPHYQVTVSARIDALSELRAQLNEQLATQGVKLSVNDFLVRACAIAMHSHPFVNSSWNPGSQGGGPAIDLHGSVNIGVAVALPEERGGGLVVATLRDADHTGLRQISAETKRLAKKARSKGLSVEEMSDSTFTISNLGMFGVDHFTAIINPPNAAILAVGRAVEKPFIEYDEDGEPALVVGEEMSMTMSSDHRIVDGAMAAQYLNTVKELLENPATLLV